MNTTSCLKMLERWAEWADRYWYPIPGKKDCGCFGTGYNAWGVQTNQKYLSAMAVLGRNGEELMLDRAISALRFSLATHVSGNIRCTDGTQWGHTWISPLGIERMMFGVYKLEPHLQDQDREALRRVLTSEADWLVERYERNGIKGISAGLGEGSGRNQPESNVWNGALLWRTAMAYPEDPRADRWKEQAHCFFINAVSVPGDEHDESLLAGLPVKDRFRGANFFPHFALDHRGFMNVGYTTICVSNAAILHFDLRLNEWTPPASLHHHQPELWKVLRRMVFADGRLARIGGATRIRYSYCQAYLLPSLLYAADHHGDEHALGLAERYLQILEREQEFNEDGSFYGKRMAHLERMNPYYTTRIETDRACVLGMMVTYLPLMETAKQTVTDKEQFEGSVAGHWCEPEHGSVLHRCATRFASFSWRSFGLTQGMCQPPDDGHLAEWKRNLSGNIRVLQHQYDSAKSKKSCYDHPVHMPSPPDRKLMKYTIRTFDGGFITSGAVMEGVDIELAEGWSGTDSAIHQLVFIALPDGHSVVGLEYCKATDKRVYFQEVQGLHLNLPNDLFNSCERRLVTEKGTVVLDNRQSKDEVIILESRWLCIDNRVAVLGLYGADSLAVSRSAKRRGGALRSLFVEEIGWPVINRTFAVEPNTVVLDVGWMVGASVQEEQARNWAKENTALNPDVNRTEVKKVKVVGIDGNSYEIWVNFATEAHTVTVSGDLDLTQPEIRMKDKTVALQPGQTRVFLNHH